MYPYYEDDNDVAEKLERARQRIHALRRQEGQEQAGFSPRVELPPLAVPSPVGPARSLPYVALFFVVLGYVLGGAILVFAILSDAGAASYLLGDDSALLTTLGALTLVTLVFLVIGGILAAAFLVASRNKAHTVAWVSLAASCAALLVFGVSVLVGISAEQDAKRIERAIEREIQRLFRWLPPSPTPPRRT